jgi:hypothetical protein
VIYVISYWPLFHSLDMPFTLTGLAKMHGRMLRFLTAVPGNPFIHTPWYRWPIQVSPQRALRYLMGNWVVMWIGLLALILCIRRLIRRVALPEMLVVVLYAVNWLQWAAIPREHTYYYYYLPAAIFLSPAIGVALARSEQ